MNLVSRYSVRDPNVLASTASESLGKTKSDSQKVPLSSLNEQQTSTVKLVMGAGSSNYSEWNIDDMLCSQERKSGEMLGAGNGETRRWQVGHRWWYWLWHRHRIKLFFKIMIILEQGEWSIAKDIGPFFRRWNARHRQTFYDLSECLCFRHWKHLYSCGKIFRQFTFHQKYRWRSHYKADVRHIWKVDSGTINWDVRSVSYQPRKIPHGYNYRWLMMKKSSVSHMQWFVVFYNSVSCLWKGESEPSIKYCLGRTVGFVQYRTLDAIDGEQMEFEWNIFQASLYCSSSTKSKRS